MPGQRGFTLLEVLVSITITGLVLGTLFTLLTESKRLAWNAGEELQKTTGRRLALNASQLPSNQRGLPSEVADYGYALQAQALYEKPEAQTRPWRFALEPYEVTGPDGVAVVGSVRWLTLDAPK